MTKDLSTGGLEPSVSQFDSHLPDNEISYIEVHHRLRWKRGSKPSRPAKIRDMKIIERNEFTLRIPRDDEWLSLEMKEFGMVLSTRDKFLDGMDTSYAVSMLVDKDYENWENKMMRYKNIRKEIKRLLK